MKKIFIYILNLPEKILCSLMLLLHICVGSYDYSPSLGAPEKEFKDIWKF